MEVGGRKEGLKEGRTEEGVDEGAFEGSGVGAPAWYDGARVRVGRLDEGATVDEEAWVGIIVVVGT